jgi:UDP-N-acetylglucosamine:LPS N-acetylglucosamine transferase
MIGAHFVMAIAIKEGLEAEFGEKCEVEICDSIHDEAANKFYKTIETKFGIKRIDIEQRIQKFIYQFININKLFFLLSEAILDKFISIKKIDKIISKEFDVIISTGPEIHNLISYMPKVMQRRPIIISVPNDVDFFKRNYIDSPNILYCIYLNKQQELLKEFNCPHFKRISGALIRKEFHGIRKISKADAKKNLGFNPDEPVIMASFGSAGNEEVFEIAKLLKDKQCILMCSKNEELKKRIEDLGNPKHRVEGFVNAEDMAKRMRATDVFIGKGGNSIIWEAIQCESIVLTLKEFIFLLEEENVKFLVENNLGKEVKKTKDLPRIVEEVLAEPAYSTYKRALAGIQNNAAQEMVEVVKDVADNYEEWQDNLWGKKRIILFKLFESGGHHETVKAIKNELQKEKWAKNWDIEELNLSSPVTNAIAEFMYRKITCFWFPKMSEVNDWIYVFFRKIGINIDNLFNRMTSDLNKVEVSIKAFYALLYIYTVLVGLCSLIFIFTRNIRFMNDKLLLTCIGLYLALIHPMGLKMEEYRYIVSAFPFLVV